MALLRGCSMDNRWLCGEQGTTRRAAEHLHARLFRGGVMLHEACVDDLTVEGCSLRGALAVERGEAVAVHLVLPDREAPLPLIIESATVCWCLRMKCGLAFQAMPAGGQERLARYLSMHARELESAILRQVRARRGTIDELAQALPMFTWNQIFSTVDRLSRNGSVVLRRLTPWQYEVLSKPGEQAQPMRMDNGARAALEGACSHGLA